MIPLSKNVVYSGNQLPAVWVNYMDIRLFLELLNGKMHRNGRLDEKLIFDLPTEAEWEYAARGGLKTEGYRISGGLYIDELAWYSGKADAEGPQAVGKKQPNELGLYDMSGNVDEWTKTSINGKYSVRGGHWNDEYNNCRISARKLVPRSTASNNLGFRLVIRKK